MTRTLASLLALALLAPLAGCGKAGAENPDDARANLQAALDAWKAGKTPAAFQEESGIVVGDFQWEGGYKLDRYELGAELTRAGYDLKCPVDLWLVTPRGKPAQEKTSFTMSTQPARTVIRAPF